MTLVYQDEILLKCGCGRVVEFRRRVSNRRPKFNCVVLCDGSLYDGHVPYYAVFKDREIQDYALVDKWGSGVSCDTYTLYHLDEELSALMKVSEALGITLAQAAHDLKHLKVDPSKRRRFIAFLLHHPELGIREALESWKSIDETEFELLGDKESTHDH